MALNAGNVRVGVTGAVYYDPTGNAAAPTSTTSATTPYKDLGYVSEDGVTLTMPGAGDSTPIKAWQNGATVRVIRTPSEDQPTLALTLIETKLDVIEAVFGVTVTPSTADGSFTVNTTLGRKYARLILDVVDGSEIIRIYAPKAIITEMGDVTFANSDPIGYNVTIACEFDQSTNGQLKVWSTALKTGA